MSIKQIGHDYDYDVEFIVDQTGWKPCRDAVDSDEEFTFPTFLYVFKNGFPSGKSEEPVSGSQLDIYHEVQELLSEWQNLVFNNDCKDRKVRVTIKVEEVA